MKIDKASITPSYQQVADFLKAEIFAGRISPGGRLPTELELVRRSKLSRITVRKGVEILENEGLVIRKQGLGTFVRPAINQDLNSVQTITEVLFGEGITPRVKVLKFAPTVPPKEVAGILGLNAGQRALQVERIFFNSDEPIARLITYLPLSLREHAEILRQEGVPSETTYTIWEKKLGVRIKAARHTLRAGKSDRQDAKHLGVKLGDPVLVLDRVSYGEDGRPLDVATFRYHWKRYEFSVMLPRVSPQGR